MSSTIPYIGSKISLISNSEIRYEGILYTINTQESTIALQSVKTFGTEGRKIPEIPPSSEIYDFIIFRGQDIKDLTVLEGAQNPSSPMLADPAIMSMNRRPPGGPGKDSQKGGGKAAPSKGKESHEKGGGGGGAWGQPSKGSSKGMSYQPSGGRSDGWGKGGGKWDDGGKGRGGKMESSSYGKGSGKGKDYQAADKGGKGGKGKGSMKGGKDDGRGMQKGKMKGGESSKGGGYGKGDGKGDRGGNRRAEGKGATTAGGVPVGELLPEENADVKRECAEEFDVAAANTKFDKVTDDVAEQTKALSGYNKTSSFFDNISCEATDRAADADRQKVDRDKARQYDRETFGDTRRPPRPLGVRRGTGKGKGGGKGGYRS